jgi:hypothetical protein
MPYERPTLNHKEGHEKFLTNDSTYGIVTNKKSLSNP